MLDSSRFQGIPNIIYGTAFKFEKSDSLVEAAIKAGFRAIDTAGSRSAYREALVGKGIAAALASGTVTRSDLYTKFSPFKPAQDPALYPYDTTNSIPKQVSESVASSLVNLGLTYLDSLVMHSVYPSMQDNLTAWRAMESLVPDKVASLGVSNIDLKTLHQIYTIAVVKPSVVQNRFTADTIDRPNPSMPSNLPYPLVTFDRDVRIYCRQYKIVYAPWGLLWGCLDVLDVPEQIVSRAAQQIDVSRQIACYAFMRAIGGCQISLLCGTTKEERMHETLAGLIKIQNYVAESDEHKEIWKGYVDRMKVVIDGDGQSD